MRAVPVAVVLVSLAVAGCIGAGPASQSGADQDWPTITDPKDLSYDTDSGMHVHDYWGGEDTLDVLDGTTTAQRANCGDESTEWNYRFHPPDGNVVPQGTASLTITVSWDEDVPLFAATSSCPAVHGVENSYGDMELWVKPADTSEHRLIEDELTNGETLEVPLAYGEADLPHQLISAWEFEVRIRGSEQDGYNHFRGNISVQTEAHRGLELRPFPPHPDHWQGRTELPLVDHEGEWTRRNNPTGGFTGMEIRPIRPPNGSIVPLDAQQVDVTLTFENNQPVGDLHLYYHAADTLAFQRLEPDEASEGRKHFTIPVDEAMADTPYANASQWVFYVDSPYDWTEDPGTFDGTYTLEATVQKE